MTTTPEFAPFGFFTHYATVDADLLRTVESLGFDTAWLGGSPPADLPWIDPLLSATERIRIVTAIVNIWSAPAQQAAQSWQRIQQAHPGRFILGIGAGHPEIDSGVAYKPYSGLVEYLDVLDQAGVPQEGRALAALAVIAYGTPEQIAARLQEHRDAGATQVAIQVLGDPADRAKTLGVLARELGL
ncbi:putative F420-dependent oxidoreductase, MSMEG_4141 family [Mycobacteroides abscessus subsp. abscessus]|nr:putative F420-dependent oxidoreductase, MSMEG_4141 family [Mycobacteroides abscessus subsp. abscessus]